MEEDYLEIDLDKHLIIHIIDKLVRIYFFYIYMSSFGNLFKINTYGESHSKSVGVIIDSPLPNINLNIEKIQTQLNRRQPEQSHITSPKNY